jgi:uncharacterized membrane protein
MDTSNNTGNPAGSVNAEPAKATKQSGNNILMGILSYLGILIIIPFLVAKENPFVKFHLKQGLVLIVLYAIVWAVELFLGGLWPLFSLVRLIAFILAIIGIVNVIRSQERELPIVGQFGKSFNF